MILAFFYELQRPIIQVHMRPPRGKFVSIFFLLKQALAAKEDTKSSPHARRHFPFALQVHPTGKPSYSTHVVARWPLSLTPSLLVYIFWCRGAVVGGGRREGGGTGTGDIDGDYWCLSKDSGAVAAVTSEREC